MEAAEKTARSVIVDADEVAERSVKQADGDRPSMTRYRDNPLEAFRNGALFDFRVRLAVELLAHGGVFETALEAEKTLGAGYVKLDQVSGLPKVAAAMALDAASELVRLAEERGLVEPFGDPEHMSKGLKDHVVRQIVFQSYVGEQQQKRAKAIGGMPMGIRMPGSLNG